ncbi:unnamed protein product [Acanthoscelides obtectus]|uniref:28S ribosomal protein S22, mitochondrial n=1 Tax=Acanthoscelides obtectus TaxID=200917 RepID=A0A9P0KEK2_ACAOB|nr:unnamed protein product [Acanthoscelides obtectus]CAK1651059.1 28S ribosomal protein S22, mitochondrial [Acanthoscelides obtectus]
MAAFRLVSKCLKAENLSSAHFTIFKRLLNYSTVEYDEQRDPRPSFFNKDIQNLLRTLTRVDLHKVFRRRKLGDEKVRDPEYKFMTDEELQEALQKAQQKANSLLQIPPVVPARKPISKILSLDPELQGLETSKMVFTDITFGVKDSDRLIVVRQPDGTLCEAEWEVKNRINQIYFPQKGRSVKPPKMFQGTDFEDLLKRQEYEFILDCACIQFEPNDPDYQRITSITYQHINDNNGFDKLRSTRHFGALTFFLVWHKNIDNLLLELIETCYADEANSLIELYSKIKKVEFEKTNDLSMIEHYIKKCSNKKGALELALQAYKEMSHQKQNIEKGIKTAHGMS